MGLASASLAVMPGSLTKEFPLDQVEATIRLARNGMQYSEFRRQAVRTTHRDIPGIVIQRFLKQQNGRIVRDRFLSLVESEGLGSARMRKIMYGTWVLRDLRVRRFVLETIANPAGIWRVREIIRKSNASFFNQFLSASTAPKVRSNIEYFLTEAGIFDPRNRAVHLELDDGWLADSVAIASGHETDAEVRRRMVNDPINYVIDRAWNGLANATPQQLRGVPIPVQPEVDAIQDDEVQVTPQNQLNARVWNRRSPTTANRQQRTVYVDSVARERASQAHFRLEQLLSSRVRSLGLVPRFNQNIDLFFGDNRGHVIAEIKSCHIGNVHAQIRRGIAQLFEYEYVYRSHLTSPIQKLLVLEMAPPSDRRWLVPFLQSIGVSVIWRRDDGSGFETSMENPPDIVRRIIQ